MEAKLVFVVSAVQWSFAVGYEHGADVKHVVERVNSSGPNHNWRIPSITEFSYALRCKLITFSTGEQEYWLLDDCGELVTIDYEGTIKKRVRQDNHSAHVRLVRIAQEIPLRTNEPHPLDILVSIGVQNGD